MMPSTYIPFEHHLMRYVPFSKLIRDDDDNVIGVLGEAFKLRPSEEYLSATWVQFHLKGDLQRDIEAAVHTIRASELKPTPKSAFVTGKVEGIDAACRAKGRKIRFIHEREADNEAHAALRHWPNEMPELFDRLASVEWSSIVLNKDVPYLAEARPPKK